MAEHREVQPGVDNTPADSPGDEHTRGQMIRLWAGILIGPTAWFAHQQLSFVLVPWICAYGGVVWLHALTLLCVAATALAGWMAWRELPGAQAEDPRALRQRIRFMATLGVCSSVFFALVVVAQGLPVLFLDPCFR